MAHAERYCELLAAYVRGNPAVCLPRELVDKPLDALSEGDMEVLYTAGKAAWTG